MKNYSIVRIGNEYVVQADEKSVLKIASRREPPGWSPMRRNCWIRSRPRHCRQTVGAESSIEP